MNGNVKKFMDMADHDDALQEKLNATSTMEELYAVASEAVGGFTLEELEAEFAKTEKESADAELADDEIDGVAGGVYAIIMRRRKASRDRGVRASKQNGDAFQPPAYKKGANDDMLVSL
ncbi:MAG: Nif11-like leader peptide family natural product precursor [Ruthenibacterium sp.]